MMANIISLMKKVSVLFSKTFTMKRSLLYILTIALVPFFSACFKDKGNYEYVNLGEPTVTELDSIYYVKTGDSLIIFPKVSLPGGRTEFSCHWKIDIPAEARSEEFDGYPLRAIWGNAAGTYSGLMILTDKTLDIKYYYPFIVEGQTEFTTGTVVLTNDNGQGKLSFIKPGGEVQPDLYEAINGEALGTDPLQIIPLQNRNYMNLLTGYWIVCKGGENPAVQISSDDFKKIKYLKENFYSPPGVLQPSYFQKLTNGTTTAILNDKIYVGTTETAPFGTYYGYFSSQIIGDYTLAPQLLTGSMGSGDYYLGFDKVKKCFLRFDNYTYYGTNYIQEDSLFNPKELNMDLLSMLKLSEENVYAFCDSVGQAYELKFALDFANTRFRTTYKRKFKGDSLLTANTKWQSSPTGMFYFTSNDKIYRYNPTNEEILRLQTDFGGKEVTMIKISEDGNRISAGTRGSLYTLDVSTGKYGDIISKVDGLPGDVVDVLIR